MAILTLLVEFVLVLLDSLRVVSYWFKIGDCHSFLQLNLSKLQQFGHFLLCHQVVMHLIGCVKDVLKFDWAPIVF